MKKALTITDLPVDEDRRDVALTLDDIFTKGYGNEEDLLRFLAIIMFPRSTNSSYITPRMLFQGFGKSYYILENLRSYPISIINNPFDVYEMKKKSCGNVVAEHSCLEHPSIHIKKSTISRNLVIVIAKDSLADICTKIIATINNFK